MPPKVSPLLGYNTNVRHKGKVYHIQTEDSGHSHPHIITHLFADGGRIVSSRKTGYAEQVGSPECAVVVKKMMQEQHKAMFIALRDGQFDDDAAGASAPTPVAGVPLPPPVGARNAPPQELIGPDMPTPPAGALAAAEPIRDIPEIDVGALERAAAERERESLVSVRASETPRIPLRRATPPGAGRYGTTHPPKAVTRTRRASQQKPPGSTPPAAAKSIFGNDLVSEKSLDEVILSYLAEDIEDK